MEGTPRSHARGSSTDSDDISFLIWSGSAAFAWLLVRGEVGAPAGARTGEALGAG
jgi:hypothetical protein